MCPDNAPHNTTIPEPFHICARGGQWWGEIDVRVIDGRAVFDLHDQIVEGGQIVLTRIQTEELTRWLARAVAR